ncbi:hypothetical protein [Streptacidiphilus jiangxiensis]|uniref:Uncharacterized protein n=1 Tax=Streptacidiphilus jiangxiensis TaxID=235985 RepID=A0A1H8ALB1_STRJI|nr:hypothetical protein [Streptacidiphilus jiangxiensis]SEM70327.1 hypothetical protein SAMN05414137_14530 [Streptacidiphilus jiangxiensis]
MPAPTLSQVLDAIRTNASREDLDILLLLIGKRRELLSLADSALIREGAQAEIRNLRPAYLSGLTGTVTALERYGSKVIATVTLDAPSAARAAKASKGRYTSVVDSLPIGCLTPR